MAKVLLIHIRPRICAALIAAAVYKKYSKKSETVAAKERYRSQSLEFQCYAAESINECYENDELQACELLWRQIPLFGNVSCIQVACSHRFVET
jgi:hypothetical protein